MLFNKQKREEKRQRKIMKQIKAKQKAMDKMEEDIKKMAKLTLKDGKLQRADDNPAPQAPMPQPAPQPAPQPQAPPQAPPMPQMPQQMPQQMPREEPYYGNPYQQEHNQQFQQPRPEPNVMLLLTLDTGATLEVRVVRSLIEGFMKEVNEAINEQTSIQIGNQLINGRHIVSVAPQ